MRKKTKMIRTTRARSGAPGLLLLALCVVFAAACTSDGESSGTATSPTAGEPREDGGNGSVARAALQPTAGNDVSGTVVFREVDGGIRIEAEIAGLDQGLHGFHIHETGDCSAADASSAGDHYAPRGSPHGAPSDAPDERHLGDLGNLEADARGQAVYERVDGQLTLEGSHSIVGKAVIVHAQPDDLASQPSGGAGARLACGVIELRHGRT